MADPKPRSLQSLFVAGVLTLLPLWLTWVMLSFVFKLLSRVSSPIVGPALQTLAGGDPSLQWMTQPWVMSAVALIATVGFILFTGWMARRMIGQTLLRYFEGLIRRIPLANTVYGSVRQLLNILQTKPDGTQRVVLIDFPNRDMKTLGMVTRVMRERDTGRELAAVYVPTTPNPTSGYLEIVPVEYLTPTDWTVDQAMSFIISGGAVSPEEIPFSSPYEQSQRQPGSPEVDF
ncbi:DUF502 domain-containing protein [Luteimonas sp. FXH3W]|uniref:DUF502 domain-containing protein n=1 Tax=Aquilutibacter rugosus TaxID=3115820 RepID=A0ABU7V0P0_9GAMM